MEGHCSTGQSPQWAVVPMEEEEIHIARHASVELENRAQRYVTYCSPGYYCPNLT